VKEHAPVLTHQLTGASRVDYAIRRREERVDHVRVVLHHELEEAHDAVNSEIVLLPVLWVRDVLLPLLEALDLRTEAGDHASQVREDQLLRGIHHP